MNEEGKKRWLLTSKLPLRDQNGKIVGLIGVGRDITFKKQAEEVLTPAANSKSGSPSAPPNCPGNASCCAR